MQHHVTFQNDSQDHSGRHRRLEIKLAKLRSRTREAPDEPAIRPPAAGEVPWAPRIQAAPLPQQGGGLFTVERAAWLSPRGGRDEERTFRAVYTARPLQPRQASTQPTESQAITHYCVSQVVAHSGHVPTLHEWARVGGGWQAGPRGRTASGGTVVTVLLMFILCRCPTINIQTS